MTRVEPPNGAVLLADTFERIISTMKVKLVANVPKQCAFSK